jgi:BASS family bile acid:Na+ symporter
MQRVLERYLLLWLVGLSLIAFHWSDAFGVETSPFVASKPYLPVLIAVTMFAIGWMLPREEVRQVFVRWPTVLSGTTLQYVSMPTLAFLVGHACGFTGDLLIGVIMVGCVPGAMASNVLTLIARGNTSYSVSLTTAATLLSPVVVPVTLKLALSSQESVDHAFLLRTSLILLAVVVLPVVVGHLLSRRFPDYSTSARKVGSMIANWSILWIIAVVVGINHERLQNLEALLLFALLAINVGGYCVGYCGGAALRLNEPMRRALTLEIGMQNAGLGATLATQLFVDRDETAIAPALYTFGCMLTGTILARIWAGRRLKTQGLSRERQREL